VSAHTSRRITPIAVVAAVFVGAVIVAAWRGYSTTAVVLALNGALISGYLVRHRMRTRLIYDRQRHVPDSQRDEQRMTSEDEATRV
jgi:uncharacterized membrane protein